MPDKSSVLHRRTHINGCCAKECNCPTRTYVAVDALLSDEAVDRAARIIAYEFGLEDDYAEDRVPHDRSFWRLIATEALVAATSIDVKTGKERES